MFDFNLSRFKKWVLAGGTLLLLAACGSDPQTQPTPLMTPPSVSVAPVISQRLTEWDEFTGRLEAPESVQLRPRVSGYIERVAFAEGALVTAGQPLFYIDSRPFEAEVKRLQAELNVAKSQQKLADLSYNRAQKLTATHAMSEEIYDQRQAALTQAYANVASVNAALELAQLNLSYTEVTAPISGRVSKANITKGNYVTAGDTILTSLVSTDKVYAYFDADEQTYLKYVKLAQEGSRASDRDVQHPVMMALANDTDYPHEGIIDFIDNRVNPSTGTIRGRAVFSNDKQMFTPGLFARIKLTGSASYQGILIDDKAIGTDLNNKFVLILDETNTVQYRPVILGEKLQGLRIIQSGLKAGDTIVVNGLQRVRPGTPVAPQQVAMTDNKTLAKLKAIQRQLDSQANRVHLAAAGLSTQNASTAVTGG
ncbi:efflux RND transporter periplasmic adaptor subunit [Corallincola holothuriorum]|uniref:Efflux RND transporter periplasmic adaptor subunit n=1 Tax=Corallincola holothuriorum TaxID=2282215 RepID=A0A368NJR3_9GAMM|nr:efflux RND transporter periplasmic adaptor subunit [Corallincola holothuriorum]RCU50847.1 efflux RND transporter periplasmic adaptor subunit [Corallincola holothuriorum]